MKVVVAYAPGIGHYNTIRPIWQELAARRDCEVYLCGSPEVARFAGKALPPGHMPSGPKSYLRSGAGISGDDVVRQMGWHSCQDITNIIDLVRPDILICDTSERGAVVAAHAKKVPFVRVVSCADAATATGIAAESRRLALIRRTDIDDPLLSLLNWGTVAFGPQWFFRTTDRSDTMPLRCYRFRPSETLSSEKRKQHHEPASSPGSKALISFGTFVHEPSAMTYCEAIAGILDAGLTSILVKVRDPSARTQVQRWAERHAEVTVTRDLDLLAHLPGADVLMCHGSATSTLESLHYGVAPLIRPSHNDAYFVAQQCDRHKAAIILDGDVAIGDIHQAVTQALSGNLSGIADFAIDNERLPSAQLLAEQLCSGRGP